MEIQKSGSTGASIAHLAWCVAEKDNLRNPDDLFRKTLSIKNYSMADGITWGVQAGAGSANAPIESLPSGISSILYQRVDPRPTSYPAAGHISLSIELRPSMTCVTLNDLTEAFGHVYWLNERPVVAPSAAVARESLTSASNIYGVIFRSPKLFSGHPSGRVSFDFEYTPCVRSFTIYRDMDLKNYNEKESK